MVRETTCLSEEIYATSYVLCLKSNICLPGQKRRHAFARSNLKIKQPRLAARSLGLLACCLLLVISLHALDKGAQCADLVVLVLLEVEVVLFTEAQLEQVVVK